MGKTRMTGQQRHLFDTTPAPWDVDQQHEQLVASVIFGDAPFGPYDYLVPEPLRSDVQPGRRVRVPFGKSNRTTVGYCTEVSNRTQISRQLKSIKTVVDSQSLLSQPILRLTKWLAEYYLCEWGQAIEAVVPAGVRSQAGTRELTFLSVPTSVAARMTQLKLPPKQMAALRVLAASPSPLTPPQLATAADCSLVPIQGLRKKGLVRAEVRRIQQGDHDVAAERREKALVLNHDQQIALDKTMAVIDSGRHETILIHGATGSGKTQVYIQAIQQVIRHGRQAIVLVPEISLTPQTRQRFRSRFDRVAVLHSHLSDAERHWHWQQIALGEVQVIVGARSAVFAPTPHLGLIVMDEEHDASFKQDKVPRYHARDVALYRARASNIPLVLGSATPSLESWHEARQGTYQMVQMPKRVLDRPLPVVTTIDLRTHGRSTSGPISRQLQAAMREALRDDGQVILLLNRRGYSTIIQCPACGSVLKWDDCEIALTHHREGEKARCHYCDRQIAAPADCPDCDYQGIRYSGLGTQRLESEIRQLFPDSPCLRMDSDSMQRPGSHEQAFARFRSGELKILLGTQMIAKGLDFPNVTLVGVVNADTTLHFPDFRAAERTFQLVTQVAGRSGRGEKGGRVFVQTFSPDHAAIVAAAQHDFHAFVEHEQPSRRQLGYPPFAKMIRLVVRGSSAQAVEGFTEQLCDKLLAAINTSDSNKIRIAGPAPAPIAKLRGKYRFHAMIIGQDAAELRKLVLHQTSELKPPDDIQWIADVDPLDML